MNQSAHVLWQQFKKKNKIAHDDYDVWGFGNSAAMADELLALVISGEKTGTSSLEVLYELTKEAIPKVGAYSVLVDGQGQGQAIIRNKVIDVLPYQQITEVHGYLEGEGNRTLAYWRSVHKPFFEAELAEYGKEFTEELLIVYELFEVVYKK